MKYNVGATYEDKETFQTVYIQWVGVRNGVMVIGFWNNGWWEDSLTQQEFEAKYSFVRD